MPLETLSSEEPRPQISADGIPIRRSRRDFLRLAAACAASQALPAAPAQPAGRPLNFVFLLVDDMGWTAPAGYGSDLHETPNLDRLAKQSLRFTNAYAASPVCTPTRASIMTGKFPARLNMTIWHEASAQPPTNRKVIPPVVEGNLPHTEVTIAERLHDAGYLTAHVGKWHLGTAGYYPETQGFDINIGGTFWGAPQTFFHPFSGDRHFGREYRYVPGLGKGKPGDYLTDRLTDEAVRIIDGAKDGPFYLNLWYHTVHTPIEGKPELVEKYRKKLKPGLHHKNPEFAAMVQSLDENVGRVLDTLEKHRIADRTVVIFASDNGGFINNYDDRPVTSNHPLRSGKGSLYEGGVRVPLMIRWPGVTPAGAVCDEPVSSIDYYPTMLEMAGLRADGKHTPDGLSLMPLLKNPKAKLNRDAMFFHYPHYYQTTTPVSSVRAREWKLLEYHEDNRVELYNLAKDLGETEDLAARMPEKAAELRRNLHQWRESVNARMPKPNAGFKGQR